MQYEWGVVSREPCRVTWQHINVSDYSTRSSDFSNENIPENLNIFEVGLQSHKHLQHSLDVILTAHSLLTIVSFIRSFEL